MSQFITKTILDRMPSDIKMIYIEKVEDYDEPFVYQLVSGKGSSREWADFAHGDQLSNIGLARLINESVKAFPYNDISFGDGEGNAWDKSEIVASLGEKTMRGYNMKKCCLKNKKTAKRSNFPKLNVEGMF